MDDHTSNLESLCWNHIDLTIMAVNHIRTIESYRAEVVRPSLRALDEKLDDYSRRNDPEAIFSHDHVADLRGSTIEGFLLTTQAMWERGLRGMLINAAAKQKANDKTINAIKSARWAAKEKDGLQAHFATFFGASLEWFGCHGDLNILQEMGNALRHGDGRAAGRLHELCPSLWVHWLQPGTVITLNYGDFRVADNAPRHPSFNQITWTNAMLEQMMLAVLWFWQDIEFVRCNSFNRKADAVIRMLEQMNSDRSNRTLQRLWTPG
jgi:hypothetical protein